MLSVHNGICQKKKDNVRTIEHHAMEIEINQKKYKHKIRDNMVFITGANGHLGSQTISFLIKKDPEAPVGGLIRSPEKGKELKKNGVETRIGDYLDKESLQDAVQGVDTLLLISSSTLKNRVKQHENVIQVAKKAGVNHIFYTSIVQADKRLSPLSADHHETEKILTASGVDYTIFRHTFYTEFFPMFLGNAMETGQWFLPSGGQKINLAYRSEMAEALANGLLNPEKHRNKIYEITSSQKFTLSELAAIISKETGKEIRYNDLSMKDFEEGLNQAGLSQEQIGMAMMTAQTVVNGALAHTSKNLKNLLGRDPATVTDYIKSFMK